MPKFHIASKQCPVCGQKSVTKIEGSLGIQAPLFACSSCGAQLKTALTLQVLWALPVCLLLGGTAYVITTWLRESQLVTGTAYSAIFGGLFGGTYGMSGWVAFRGIIYRPWES
jgi:predicted RNA-binding Zn-ribbon protein involved in translation (DUF1610 family)